MTLAEIIGIVASVLVLSGFVPQIIKGYRTKRMKDVSYFLMVLIGFGMFLWIIYGYLRGDFIIMLANVIGVSLNAILILMKRHYEKKK